MSSGTGRHATGSDGLPEPGARSTPSASAAAPDSTAKPAPGGPSRTELAKARLEEKRQRLAQQKARIAARSGATGPPSLQRTASSASRAGSDTSSVTSPVAAAPKSLPALQPPRSNGSAVSRPGAGALSEALRSPRRSSAAIAVPTSPAHAMHSRRHRPEQERPPQLPRPVVHPGASRPSVAAAAPLVADISLGGASGWGGLGLQFNEGAKRVGEMPAGGENTARIPGVQPPEAPLAAALERSLSQTSTPRLTAEQASVAQLLGKDSSTERLAAAFHQSQLRTSAQAQPGAGERTSSNRVTGASISIGPASEQAASHTSAASSSSISAAASGSEPRADESGFSCQNLAAESQATLQQGQWPGLKPPETSLRQPRPATTAGHVPDHSAAAGTEARPQSTSMDRTSCQEHASVPMNKEPAMPGRHSSAAEQRTSLVPAEGPQHLQQQPEPQAATSTKPDSVIQAAFAGQEMCESAGAISWVASGSSSSAPFSGGGGAQALFSESVGVAGEEDDFWTGQEGPQGHPAALDVSQEQAAHSLAAQAAQLGRDDPNISAQAAQSGTDQPSSTAQPAATEPPMQQQRSAAVSAAFPDSHAAPHSAADTGTLDGDLQLGRPNAQDHMVVESAEAATVSATKPAEQIALPEGAGGIPFAEGAAAAADDLFPGGADPFGGAIEEDASFFEELDSAGNATDFAGSASAATYEQSMPESAPAATLGPGQEYGQQFVQRPDVCYQSQYSEQAQPFPSFGDPAAYEPGTSAWHNSGAANYTDPAQSAGQEATAYNSQPWDATQESRAQAASHGQPPAPADSYANGGHNYYAAGWQPPQPPRPKTAEPAAKQSGFGGLVPKQWVGRQEAPQSAAQAQPMFGNGQAGPPPPAFGGQQQQQAQSAQTFFAQPQRPGPPSFLPPAAPPPAGFGRQPQPPPPAPQAAPASSQWPVHAPQQAQHAQHAQHGPPPVSPGSHAPPQPLRWQPPQAQQWGAGAQNTSSIWNHGGGAPSQQQWQQSSSAYSQAHAPWDEASQASAQQASGAAVSYYPDPPEPLEAAASEQPSFHGGPGGGVQAQPLWQGGAQSEQAPQAATTVGGAQNTGAGFDAGAAAPGLDVSETDFWGLQGDEGQEDPFGAGSPAHGAAVTGADPLPASTAEQPEQPSNSEAAAEPALPSSAAQPARDGAAAAMNLSQEHQPTETAHAEGITGPEPQSQQEPQQPSWPSDPQTGRPQAAVSLPESQLDAQAFLGAQWPDHGFPVGVEQAPDASTVGQYSQPWQAEQPALLDSYVQADWNAAQWRQQQAEAGPYNQPGQQQQFQPGHAAQWAPQQHQQPISTGYEQYHGADFDGYARQQAQQQQPISTGYEPYQSADSDGHAQQQQGGYEGSMQQYEGSVPAHAGPGVTKRVGPPFTLLSPRTPSRFHQPPAALWGSQIRRQSAADAGLVPGVAAEGTRVVHGRPPCAVLAWGFGGRCVVMRPRAQGTTFSAGAISLDTRWQPGPLQLMRRGSLASELSQMQTQAQWMQAGVKDDSPELMERFPGPLTSSTSRDKVLAFIAGEAAREVEADRASVAAAMWQVLRLLALNSGSLRTQSKLVRTTKDQDTPEAQLAKILVPDAGGPSADNGWGASGPAMHSPLLDKGADPAAAARMQALLIGGHKTEALNAAVEGQLWGPALLLARVCGDRAFSETAAAMAAAAAAPGTPLHSLLHVLAGRPDLVLPAARGAPGGASPGGPAGQPGRKSGPPSGSFGLKALLTGSTPQQEPGSAAPDEAEPSEAEVAMLTAWRENLAILAANASSPTDEALIVRLGDRLWQHRGQVEAAHLCYMVAGLAPQSFDVAARLCLLGADHRASPRCFASVAALQRTEVLEWAKLPGAAQPAALTLPMLPYKVLYAAQLAEAGLVAPAVHYAGLVQAALAALGAKVPPGLLVCRAMVAELEERLRTHAAMFKLSVKHSQSSSFIGGLGRFLDRGINKLISGGDVPLSGPPSTGSEGGDPFGLHRRATSSFSDSSSPPQHRRSSSFHALTPSGSAKDLSSQQCPAGMAVPNQAPQHPARSGSPGPKPPRPPGSASAPSQPAAPDQAAPAPAQQRPEGSSGSGPGSASSLRSMLGNLGGLLGTAAPANKREAKLGEENKFFYDKELGVWREAGAPVPEAPAQLPPPPKGRPAAAAPPSGGPSAAVALQPPFRRTGASARYVNNMATTSRASNAGTASLPPLVPAAAAARPAKPAFFVPGGAREGSAAAASTQALLRPPPGSADRISGSPSPARIEGQPQQTTPDGEQASSGGPWGVPAPDGAIGGGWRGAPPPDHQGMGGRAGSFSQYLSPPVSNGTSQGPPSPPQGASQASRFGPNDASSHPSAAAFSSEQQMRGAAGSNHHAELGSFECPQQAEAGQVAGGDYYTSYSAVLGSDSSQGYTGAPAWAAQPAPAQQFGLLDSAAAAGVAEWAGSAAAADEMTELEL